jgi:hypothetical protein
MDKLAAELRLLCGGFAGSPTEARRGAHDGKKCGTAEQGPAIYRHELAFRGIVCLYGRKCVERPRSPAP